MKTTKKLTELTLAELQTKKKQIQGPIIGLASVLIIACILLLYLAITKKNYALIAVALCCSVTLVPSFILLIQIHKEIKSRL